MSGADFWRRGTMHAIPGGKDWLARCQLDSNANPIPNLHNVLLALRLDPTFNGTLRYDEMRCAVVSQATHPIEDIDVFRIHEWLQHHGLIRLGPDPVREAIEIVGREHPFHPIRDWLNSLVWDGNLRLASWLSTCLGADDSPYTRAIGAMFLTAMVARIFQPGCKADYMPVLEGPQGLLKSSACRLLAGDDYFSDALPDLSADAVRLAMHLRGKWLIEVSELSAFSKPEAAHLKAFITSQVEQYIPKFARLEVRQPRQCLFIGSTNDDTYLKDDTGGRRFWPTKCGHIDLDTLARDRSQLFAEAVEAFRNGAHWWPDRSFERNFISPVQETRRFVDAWANPVHSWLNDKTHTRLSLAEVAQGALSIEPARFTVPDQRRLSSLMREYGWISKKSDGVMKWQHHTYL